MCAGEGIGYGGLPLDRDTRVIWTGIGYGDGSPDTIGSHESTADLRLMINGHECPPIVEINMDLLAVEAPPDAEIAEGDMALIAGPGTDGEMTYEQWSSELNVPVDLLLTAPHGRTRVVFHDGSGLQAPPIYPRTAVTPTLTMVRATTDIDAPRQNIDAFRQTMLPKLAGAPMPKILLVTKADGYGNNANLMAQAAARSGAYMVGAVHIEELLQLRAEGNTMPALAWGTNPRSPFVSAIRADVQVATPSEATLEAQVEAAMTTGLPVRVHLFSNVGLNREGFDLPQLERIIPTLHSLVADGLIVVEGHMAHTDHGHSTWERAFGRWTELDTLLRENGIEPQLRHLWASHVVHLPVEYLLSTNMVRLGTGAYGNDSDFAETTGLKWPLKVTSDVAHVFLGSNTDGAPARLAAVPAGYADVSILGTPRGLEVEIGGRKYPVVGQPERHSLLVDLGTNTTVKTGDEVILVGPHTLRDYANAGGGVGIFLGSDVSHATISDDPPPADLDASSAENPNPADRPNVGKHPTPGTPWTAARAHQQNQAFTASQPSFGSNRAEPLPHAAAGLPVAPPSTNSSSQTAEKAYQDATHHSSERDTRTTPDSGGGLMGPLTQPQPIRGDALAAHRGPRPWSTEWDGIYPGIGTVPRISGHEGNDGDEPLADMQRRKGWSQATVESTPSPDLPRDVVTPWSQPHGHPMTSDDGLLKP